MQPGAISEERTDRSQQAEFLKELRVFWRDHGILVVPAFPEDQFYTSLNANPACGGIPSRHWEIFRSELKKAYDNYKITDDTRTILDNYRSPKLRLLKLRPTTAGNQSFSWTSTPDQIDIAAFSDVFRLAFLEPTHATVRLGDDSCKMISNGDKRVEVAFWHFVRHTDTNQKLDQQKQCKVSGRVADIWDTYFKSLVEFSTNIAVVDPYAFTNLSTDTSFGNFVSKVVAGGGRECHLNFYSVQESVKDTSRLEERLKDEIMRLPEKRRRITVSVTLFSKACNDVHQLFHKRWCRFDHNVLELDRGIELFRNDYIYPDRDVPIGYLHTPLMDIPTDHQSAPDPIDLPWCFAREKRLFEFPLSSETDAAPHKRIIKLGKF